MVKMMNPIPPTRWPTKSCQLMQWLTHHWHTTDASVDTANACWPTCWLDQIHYLYLDTHVNGDCMCVFMDTCQDKEALYCKSQ